MSERFSIAQADRQALFSLVKKYRSLFKDDLGIDGNALEVNNGIPILYNKSDNGKTARPLPFIQNYLRYLVAQLIAPNSPEMQKGIIETVYALPSGIDLDNVHLMEITPELLEMHGFIFEHTYSQEHVRRIARRMTELVKEKKIDADARAVYISLYPSPFDNAEVRYRRIGTDTN